MPSIALNALFISDVMVFIHKKITIFLKQIVIFKIISFKPKYSTFYEYIYRVVTSKIETVYNCITVKYITSAI